MPNGPFSLPAELYLLAWDTKAIKLTRTASLHLLVRAGALTELAQRGRLVDVDGIVTPADDSRTGDPVLDGLLELIEESRPRTWKAWVSRDAGLTLGAVRDQLRGTGHLRTETRRVLGLFPAKDHVLDQGGGVAAADALKAGVLGVLRGTQDVSGVPERAAALVALAAAGELRTVITAADAAAYEERVAVLTQRAGAAAPALRKVLEEVRAALVVAILTAAIVPPVTAGGS
ncbi:GPP34 family phosphoprotein [Streptomyces pathocidini]|uniref:GOLPH3/VPS74 family protein n=1 Tax=Streptomyces pathocidini TaxID=1650571 RepID=UPI0033E9A55F